MSKIILSGHIIVPSDDLDAVVAAMGKHAELTRLEAGCLVFDITEDESDKHRFNLYEEFVDSEAFKYHQERARNSEWGEISANVERHFNVSGMD